MMTVTGILVVTVALVVGKVVACFAWDIISGGSKKRVEKLLRAKLGADYDAWKATK